MFEKTEWESTCGGDTARTANSGDLFKRAGRTERCSVCAALQMDCVYRLLMQ